MFCKVKRQHWLNNVRYYKHKIWSPKYQDLIWTNLKKKIRLFACVTLLLALLLHFKPVGGGHWDWKWRGQWQAARKRLVSTPDLLKRPEEEEGGVASVAFRELNASTNSDYLHQVSKFWPWLIKVLHPTSLPLLINFQLT